MAKLKHQWLNILNLWDRFLIKIINYMTNKQRRVYYNSFRNYFKAECNYESINTL